MLIFIYFIGILIFANLNCISMFVVTKFDLPTITKYYISILDRPGFYHSAIWAGNFFEHQNLVQFCQQLRESIFFDRTNHTDVSQTYDFVYSSENQLELELEVPIIDYERHDIDDKDSKWLPSFECWDPEGVANRVIAPGMVPNTAILSILSIDQIRHTRKVELTAVIDAPAVILNSTINFNDFINARKGLQRDPLCDLKKLLKYRLCAAASIGLGRIDHRYLYNFYYQSEYDEESCRHLEGIDRTSGRYPKMLYCIVKLTNSWVFQSFYLSLDVLRSKNIFFIRQVRNGSQYIHETKYFYVPLLDHLEIYEDIFKYVNI